MTDDIAKWLLEQIAEDESVARSESQWTPGRPGDESWHTLLCAWRVGEGISDNCECHVPARVLAECGAKRWLVTLHRSNDDGSCISCMDPIAPCDTLLLLALPYADRPGYQPAWKP